jgi:hypothetical protein
MLALQELKVSPPFLYFRRFYEILMLVLLCGSKGSVLASKHKALS